MPADALLDETIQRRPAVWCGQIESRIVSLAGVEFDRHLHVTDVRAIGPRDELLQSEAFRADAQRTGDGYRSFLRIPLARPDPQAGCLGGRDKSAQWEAGTTWRRGAEHLDDLIADRRNAQSLFCEDRRRDAALLAEETEQHVLRPAMFVQQSVGFLPGVREYRLRFVAERHLVRLRCDGATRRAGVDLAAHSVHGAVRAGGSR